LLQSFAQHPMGRQPAASRSTKKAPPLLDIPEERPALPPRVEAPEIPPPAAPPDGAAQPFAGMVEKAEPITAQPREVDPVAESIARLEQMIGAEPGRADLHRKLGFLLAKQGRNKDAAEAFRRAVECGRQRRTG
jgi:hypothetical protein